MRILVLLTDAFGGIGGIAKFNRDLLRALCSYPKCEEVAVLPRISSGSAPAIPQGIRYVDRASRGKAHYIIASFGIMMESTPDLVICAHLNLLPVAYLYKAIKKAPLCLIFHGIEAWAPRRGLFDLYLNSVDRFIAVSETTKDRFLKWTQTDKSTPFNILPNCIDLSQFSPGPKDSDLVQRYQLDGKKVIMTLARLDSRERYKGIDEVLDVFPGLVKKIPNLVYLIAGDGDDRRRLEEKVKSLKVYDNVIFTGYVPEEKKAKYYRLADAFVMPGRGEGFGIVYLEAMACGIPVVASKIDGSHEAVKDGEMGILVDPRDPDDTVKGILKALGESSGRRPVHLEQFSFDRFEKSFHEIMDLYLAKSFRSLS